MSFIDKLIRPARDIFLQEELDDYLSLDTETTGLELHHSCKPFFVSTCDPYGKTKFWEWKVNPKTRQPKVPKRHLIQITEHVQNKILVFHNASFDIRALETIGIKLKFKQDKFQSYPKQTKAVATCQSFHDTILASHAIRTSDPRKLKDLALLHLDFSDKDERDLKKHVADACRYAQKHHPDWKLGVDLKGTRQTASDYWIPKAVDSSDTSCETYGCADVERTILLWLFYLEKFDQENKDFDQSLTCYLREKLLFPSIFKQESKGITIRNRSLTRIKAHLKGETDNYRAKTVRTGKQRLSNAKFNPDSAKDNIELLFNNIKGFNLPILKKTEKGTPSTDKDTLHDLLKLTLFPKAKTYLKNLLKTRAHQSSLRYLESYRRHMLLSKWPSHSILHTSIHQTGTGTTRQATSSPNQQNISIKELVEIDGHEIPLPSLRSMFSPPPGKVWYSIDYSQLELRIFAVLSGDKKLIAAFDRGEDIHNFVATTMFPGKLITKELRRVAKAVSFGIIYGKAAKNIDLAAGFAGAYELFISKFTQLPITKRKLIAFARRHGYVETLFGYQLDIPSDRMNTTVIDYVCQGTAGDIIKNATIALDKKKIIDWKHSSILLQIHDELLIEVDDHPKYNNAKFLKSVIDEMEGSGKDLGVHTPVEVDLITKDWSRGKPVQVIDNEIQLITTS